MKKVPIYQLKVTLKGSKPPIWRRIQVRSDIRLDKLHYILQITMGWLGGHLHMFEVNGIPYSEPDPEFPGDTENERKVRLDRIAGKGSVIRYEYDFGDSWVHDIKIEKVIDPEPGVHYPRCIAGERACPPEDCGGIWGYEHFLEAIGNPEHEEHATMLDWIGGGFDPETFDLDGVNEDLGQLR
ncbi:MAG: plasmid pRiA4b ORF-3 family protein [Chromatiales bacterium]|jgi:hypothetical protein|nr:plasmid pRiA4b ORF-3 family protein [Chromatiales bacterium]MDY0067523.1 plasmid pRiA4b ORF-3 family protein [Steroidobacteraceae bacterium]